MATAVHCIACFEALDAHLNKRKRLPLDEIESSWAAYTSSSRGASSSNKASGSASALLKDPSLSHLASSSASSASSSSSSANSAGASTPGTSTSSLPLASVVASNIPTSTPLFVTWNTVDEDADDDDDDDVSLRGCIGTFEAQPLAEGLPEYAVISAIHDTRFSPITKSELPSLQAAVTLLTDFEEVDDPYDWEVGVHGVRLSFRDGNRRYGSTYLPDVASEQGWSREEALYSLTRKAGWMGGQSRWKNLDLKVTRYQGKKSTLRYAEFKKWRNWLQANGKQ